MSMEIAFNIGDDWKCSKRLQHNGLGEEETVIEASCADGSFIEISIGAMPEGETAQDQAFANYVDTVGFSDDDPEGFNPIARLKFNGKTAWGFDAYMENNTPMRLITQEVKSGILAVIVFGAPDRDALVSLHQLIERTLRVRLNG